MTSLDDLLSSSDTQTNTRPRSVRQELFFKAGDEAYVTFMSKIDYKDDPMWSTLSFFSWYDPITRKAYQLLDDPKSNKEHLPPMEDRERLNFRIKNMFALWVYVHGVLHEQYEDGYEMVEVNNVKKFKEPVKDYKLLALGYGHQGATRAALKDIQEKWDGDLTKGVIKVRRDGDGLQTSYRLTDTNRTDELPSEPHEFQDVLEYYQEKYGEIWQPTREQSSQQIEVKKEASLDSEISELF